MNDLSHHYNAAKALLDYFNQRQLSATQANEVLNWMHSQLLANVHTVDNPDGKLTFDKPLQSSYDKDVSTVPPEHGGQEATSYDFNPASWLAWAENNDLPPGLYEYIVVKATSDEPDYGGFPKPRPFPTPEEGGPREGDRWSDTNEGWVKVYRDGAWHLEDPASHGETPHTDENMSDRIKAIEIQITALANAVGEIMRGKEN